MNDFNLILFKGSSNEINVSYNKGYDYIEFNKNNVSIRLNFVRSNEKFLKKIIELKDNKEIKFPLIIKYNEDVWFNIYEYSIEYNNTLEDSTVRLSFNIGKYNMESELRKFIDFIKEIVNYINMYNY